MEEISAKNVKKSIDKPFVLWYNLSTSAKEFFCCAHFLGVYGRKSRALCRPTVGLSDAFEREVQKIFIWEVPLNG